MNTRLYLTIAAVIALTSCESTTKLADKLQGSWAGTTERMRDDFTTNATYMPVYTFVKTDNAPGGNVNIAALLTAQGSLNGSAGFTVPMTMSASGRATINGTWTTVDDDELRLTLDPSTLMIYVDPEAVTYTTLSGIMTPELDSLRPSVVRSIQERLKTAMFTEFLDIKSIDDISIDNNGLMSCEINGQDITLMRQ